MSHIKSYTVVKGDNLTKIAKANDTTVSVLLGANQDIKNPNLILVGQEIKIPEAETVDLSAGKEIIDVTPQAESKGPSMRDMSIEHQRQAKMAAEQRLQDELKQRQINAARQQETERRNAGQVSQEANTKLRNELEQKKVAGGNRDMSIEQQRQIYSAREQKIDEQKKLAELNRVQSEERIKAQEAAANANKIPKIGEDGLIVLEKSEAGQKVINKLFYEIPSHKGGKHSEKLDQMIDNLSAEECAWVLTRIEDRGFGQTGAGYAGKATPKSHANFIQEQIIDRFGGDIHNVLKSWGTRSYTGY